MEMPKENNKTPITKKSKTDQLISSDINIVASGINNNDKQANGILNLLIIFKCSFLKSYLLFTYLYLSKL